MTNGREQQRPVARREGLLVEKLLDEILVYDLDRKKAHCLNQTAALIWNHCDGNTSVEDIALILQKQSERKVGEDVVWFGLDRLHKARLLEAPLVRPDGKERLSRRELVKKIGLAVSIPLVVTILAPQASAAISCVGPVCVSPAQCSPPCTCIANKCQ